MGDQKNQLTGVEDPPLIEVAKKDIQQKRESFSERPVIALVTLPIWLVIFVAIAILNGLVRLMERQNR